MKIVCVQFLQVYKSVSVNDFFYEYVRISLILLVNDIVCFKVEDMLEAKRTQF